MAWPTDTVPLTGSEDNNQLLTVWRPNARTLGQRTNEMIVARSVADGVAGLDATVKVIEDQLRQVITAEFKTANYVATIDDLGKTFVCEGTVSFTLFEASGFNVFIKNGNLATSSDVVTVLPSGGTSIEGQGQIELKPGEGAWFLRAGVSASWYVRGDLQLQNIPPFSIAKHSYFHDTTSIRQSVNQNNIAKDGWRSIGKTGSAADYVYTELDVIPNQPAFIKARIVGSTLHSSGTGQLNFACWGRVFGSASAQAPDILIVEEGTFSDQIIYFGGEKVLPIDTQGRFEIFWQESAGGGSPNTAFNLYLEAFYL